MYSKTFFFYYSVSSDIQFFERNEGESVVLPCVVEQRNPSPFGMYLKRNWLHPGEVIYKMNEADFYADNKDDESRISVSGDPSIHSLNVTVSQLTASDTDHYYCEFVVEKTFSEDEQIRGTTEFFLHVKAGEFFFFLFPSHSFFTCLSPTIS